VHQEPEDLLGRGEDLHSDPQNGQDPRGRARRGAAIQVEGDQQRVFDLRDQPVLDIDLGREPIQGLERDRPAADPRPADAKGQDA